MPYEKNADNSQDIPVIELQPEERPAEKEPEEHGDWGVPLTHASGFVSSWSANTKTQFDYEGAFGF